MVKTNQKCNKSKSEERKKEILQKTLNGENSCDREKVCKTRLQYFLHDIREW